MLAGPERPEPLGAARTAARAHSSRAGHDIAVSRSAVALSAAETFDPSPPFSCKSMKERIYPLRYEREGEKKKQVKLNFLVLLHFAAGNGAETQTPVRLQ